jgi:dipeptidyl-peptidase-4
MKAAQQQPFWATRYPRAVAVTAPRLAASAPGTVAGGYWVDQDEYFFQVERHDEALGRAVLTPAIVSIATGQITDIPLCKLRQVLSEMGVPVDSLDLAGAIMDMPEPYTLGISAAGRNFKINLKKWTAIDVHEATAERSLYSPDGRYACSIKGADLWLRDRRSGLERLLAHGSTHPRVAQPSETELATIPYRESPWPVGLWSPDSRWFLTHRIEESHVPELSLIQHAPPGGLRARLHRMKYALPEDPLPVETLMAFNLESGRIVDFAEFPQMVSAYSTFAFRYVWFGENHDVWFIRRDRYCKWMELICLDLRSGEGRVVIREETSSGYLDARPIILGCPNVRTLPGSREVIWYSERDGWGHLYLYDSATGELKNQVTQGSWCVRDIVAVNAETRTVLLLAGGMSVGEDPARRTLCAAALDGRDFKILRRCDGDIYIAPLEPIGVGQDRPFRPQFAPGGVSPDHRYVVLRESHVSRGNTTRLIALESSFELLLAATTPPDPQGVTAKPVAALAADGKTQLHGVLFLPREFDPAARYPLVDYIYPGPQLPQSPQSYAAVNAGPALSLAELGFAVLMLDTRGSPGRSREFHQVGYPDWLEPQLADHAAVVRTLCRESTFLDVDRVGVLGHSAGGAAAAQAMFNYSDLFTVGVAVCGLHAPCLGLATWSDKYSGPVRDRSAPIAQLEGAASRLVGKLLLVAGDLDENVPLSQTLRLADALIRSNRDFDLLVVPNESHLLLMTSGYVQRRVWDYFVTHLMHECPPREFDLNYEAHELLAFGRRYLADFL